MLLLFSNALKTYVGHVATERGAASDSTVGVNVRDVGFDVVEHSVEVSVWCSAPVGLDLVGEGLAVRRCAGELCRNNNEALLCPEAQIPAHTPVVTLGRLRSTVDDEHQRVLLFRVEVGRVEDERLDHVAILVLHPKVRGRVGQQTSKLGIDFVSREDDILILARVLLVEDTGCPRGGS